MPNTRWFLLFIAFFRLFVGHAEAYQISREQLTSEETAMISRAIESERTTATHFLTTAPMVQTYLQYSPRTNSSDHSPVADSYTLERNDLSLSRSRGAEGQADYRKVNRSLHATNLPGGYLNFVLLDPNGFDREHYNFKFVRRDYLGNVPTASFDIEPRSNANGFSGRIWVETRDSNIVRFRGRYRARTSHGRRHRSFECDSWRQNVQDRLWLPVSSYITGNSSKNRRNLFLTATIRIWGYGLARNDLEAEDVGSAIDEDVSPLGAQREWISQAEDNVLDRLVTGGLLAPPSEIDKTLEAIANNIIVSANIELNRPIHCRVMLTDPLESLAIGTTIILSKGLIDVLPTEADVAAVMSFQLAHIVYGHKTDTRYAFNDRLLLSTKGLPPGSLRHTVGDNDSAAKTAVDLLNKSVYAKQLGEPANFLDSLESRSKALRGLTTPRIGDSLLRPDGRPWLDALQAEGSSALGGPSNKEVGLSLGSRLSTDAWVDNVSIINRKAVPLLSPREGRPFAIEPEAPNHISYSSSSTEIASTTDSPGNTENDHVVEILFATDRAMGKNLDRIQQFTGDRASGEDLVFGSASVNIPPGHKVGVLEEASIWRLRLTANPGKDVMILNAQVVPAATFKQMLEMKVFRDPKKEALVFVHGYNVSFDEAARRLAQITYDLDFKGAPILYSWPSQGHLLGYLADEGSAEWSSPHFLSFLKMLRQTKSVDTIYVIGHSMGNRLVSSAFRALGQEHMEASAKFKEVIMAAPDVDVGIFSQLADSFSHAAPHITIYESSKDLALTVSHKFHSYARLGDTDPSVHIFKKYECIDATSVDTSLIGHSYLGDSPSILSDIFEILTTQSTADHRFRLSQHNLQGIPYWSFRK